MRCWGLRKSGEGSDREDRSDGASAFDLEESWGGADEERAVPEPAGVLTSRSRRHYGPEEGDAPHRDYGRAHVVTHQVHGALMAGAQLDVHVGAVGEPEQVRGQTDLIERLGDDLAVVLLAARVDAGAHRVIQGLDHPGTVLASSRDDDANRPP